MKATRINTTMLIACMACLLSMQVHALTSKEQADAFHARGVAAEEKGELSAAANCYTLALRVNAGHKAAQARLTDLEKKIEPEGPLKIVLPVVEFKEATLAEGMEWLTKQIATRSLRASGLNFQVVDSTGKLAAARITVALTNIPVQDALNYVLGLANAQFRFDGKTIFIFPSEPPVPTEATGAKLAQLNKEFVDGSKALEHTFNQGNQAALRDYLASLQRVLEATQRYGDKAVLAAFQEEIKRVSGGGSVPAADSPATPATLAGLRKTYRTSTEAILKARSVQFQSLCDRYERSLASLTASLAAKSADADAVQVMRVRVAAMRREGSPTEKLVASSLPPRQSSTPAIPAVPMPSSSVSDADDRIFGGHRYRLLREKTSWTAAKAWAESLGGHLATITSKEENEWIKETFIKKMPGDLCVWLGGTSENTPGIWRWITGEPFQFTDWIPNEPNKADTQVSLRFNKGTDGKLGWGNVGDSGIFAKDRRGGLLVEWDDPRPRVQATPATPPAAPVVSNVGSSATPPANPAPNEKVQTPAAATALSSNAQLRKVVEKFVTLNPNGVKLLVDRQVVDHRALPLPARAFDLYEFTIGGDPAKAITDQDVDYLGGGRAAQVIWLNDAPISRLDGLKPHSALRSLSMNGTAVNDESLKALAGMKSLQELSLNGTKVSGPGLASLAGCGNLIHLSVWGTQIQDEHLAPLAQLKNLTRLYIGNTKVRGAGLNQLAGLAKLTYLSLDGLELEPSALDTVSRIKSLTGLDLNSTKLAVSHFDRVGTMSDLENLFLGNVTIAGNKLSDGDLSRLAALTKLKELSVNNTSVTGTGLAALTKARNLDRLAFEDTSAVTDEGLLVAIRAFPSLTAIFVGGKVTEASLASLSQLKKLKFLKLNGPDIGDAGVAALPALRGLEALELNAARATASSAAALARQPNLIRLSIAGTALNDDSIPHLAKIKTLRDLHLGNAPISGAGVDKLKKALPGCNVWR